MVKAAISAKECVAIDKLVGFFSIRADDYSERSDSGVWAWVRRQEFRTVLELLNRQDLPLANSTILEVGCGAGFYAGRLARLFGSYRAIDINPNMISACHRNGISAELLTIEKLDASARFDVILFAGVLEFITDPTAALAAARQRLRENGSVVWLLPRFGLRGWLYSLWHNLNQCPTNYISQKHFDSVLHSSGFILDNTQSAGPLAQCCRLSVKIEN